MANKIFLLDAYALIFRSYYAFIRNPRINSKGFNTSAIFGFVNTLEEVIKKERPTHIAVVFDPPGPNFRHEMYPEYKANREATPEDIRAAVPYIKKILEAYKIPVIEIEGYEADDVIGTLAKKYAKNGNIVYMMTPDKDFGQLVDKNILIYKPGRSGNSAEIINSENIQIYYGVNSPSKVRDILALWGDVSDNVPGVPGIGEKTASKLISEFGSIDDIFRNIEKLSGKQKENILNNKEQLILSRELVTIKTDVPVNVDLKNLEIEKPNTKILAEIFDELEFRTLKERILKPELEINLNDYSETNLNTLSQTHIQLDLFGNNNLPLQNDNSETEFCTFNKSDVSYNLVETEFEIDTLIENLKNYNEICIDTETSSLNPWEAELLGMAISVKEKEAFYVLMPESFDLKIKTLEKFKPIFQNKDILIIGQNLKYDLTVLLKYGIRLKTSLFDTMIAHYLLQPEQKHNLDTLAQTYLGYKMVSIESLIGKKGKGQRNMKDIDVKIVSDYACEDADITLRLKKIFKKQIEENNLYFLFNQIEMPLVYVLIDMEAEGVKVDTDYLRNYAIQLREELQKIEQKIYSLAGIEFNISSPKQLGMILFERLKIINNPKKTKTQQYSTGEEELVKLSDKHPIVNDILDYRSVNKLLNTYVEVLPQLVNPKTGKIHTSFNQTITSTGRLSSNNPNLQNIPIREERGREIRKCFVASDSEHIFFSADYSQIELRLMAHLSNDKNMLEAFNKYSLDIHTATAAKIFKVDEDKVSKEMRAKAKTANFGIIYGISAFGLSQRLNIPVTEAKQLIDSYFESFPGVKSYMDECIRKARDKEYVETIFGRRRYLPDINSRNSVVRGFAERNAINAPIQGSAADIIKLAMVKIANRFREENLNSKMILQVHDELNFDVYKPELEKVKEIVVFEMENVISLKVPLVVDYGIAENWLDAH
ncbi:MAG: DNA polymerase I [Flavobacterium piscis]|nr:DNA polymerase I [Flavobacterium piscis]